MGEFIQPLVRSRLYRELRDQLDYCLQEQLVTVPYDELGESLWVGLGEPVYSNGMVLSLAAKVPTEEGATWES